MNNPNQLLQEIKEAEQKIKKWKQQLQRINNPVVQTALNQNIQSARSESEQKIKILHNWLNRK